MASTQYPQGGGGVFGSSFNVNFSIATSSAHSVVSHATSGAHSAVSQATSGAQSGASVTGSTSAAGSSAASSASTSGAAAPGAIDGSNWKKGFAVAGMVGFSFLLNLFVDCDIPVQVANGAIYNLQVMAWGNCIHCGCPMFCNPPAR